MATGTMQRERPQQNQKTGSWATIFPNEQVTEQQSALFVKKLLAVAISNITYLRTIFPEHAFGDRCLEDLNLKILRDDSACPGACQVIQWVKGCFDALDKKYLRMIIVGIYMDASDTSTVVETYTFKFSYNCQEGISIFRNGSKIASAYTEAETRKATIKLLRTIVVLTQTLKPLPDDVMMTMKLLYYDDVTPQEYEPPGFQSTAVDDFSFNDEPMNIRVGDVSTSFHTVKLRIRTACQQFTVCDDEGEGEKGEGGEGEKGRGQQPETMETDCAQDTHHQQHTLTASQGNHHQQHTLTASQGNHHQQHTLTASQEEQSTVAADSPVTATEPREGAGLQPSQEGCPEGKAEEPRVRCPCGVNEDDGLMVLCGDCGAWQHAVCFALLAEEQVPELHICELCSQEGSQQCTDQFLQFLSPTALQATCLWRRALVACGEITKLLTPAFSRRLGVEMSVAQGLVNRLEREGFVRAPPKAGRGRKLGKVVNRDKIRNEGMRKYFESARKDTANASKPAAESGNQPTEQERVDDITQRASSLKLSGKSKLNPPKPSALPKLDDVSVRRSPRIAKRVRSLVDQSVEFDLSNSQDPDTSCTDSNDGRRKRRKASIASRSILV